MEIDPQQVASDTFYWKHGPCCAGCDWWRRLNTMIGECTQSAPVSGRERMSMLGITVLSCNVDAGHIVTPRDHYCGEFADTFDWPSLGPFYLRKIGAPAQREEG